MSATERCVLAATAAALGAVASLAGTARAAIAPYAVDANTTHLYHFDEQVATTTTADAVTANPIPLTISGGANINNLSYQADGYTSANGPPGAPLTTAGRAGSTSSNGRIFDGGNAQSAATLGITDAFTIDAVVKLASIDNGTTAIQITALSTVFQFRIVAGNLSFVRSAAGNQNVTVAIPTTGDNAFDPNAFFHVAIAYNGAQNTANNATFYWTKLTDSTTAANPIGSVNIVGDLTGPSVAQTFGVANRSASVSEELGGTIDELRFSNVARTADQFIFGAAVPEPTTLAVVAGAVTVGLRRRRC